VTSGNFVTSRADAAHYAVSLDPIYLTSTARAGVSEVSRSRRHASVCGQVARAEEARFSGPANESDFPHQGLPWVSSNNKRFDRRRWTIRRRALLDNHERQFHPGPVRPYQAPRAVPQHDFGAVTTAPSALTRPCATCLSSTRATTRSSTARLASRPVIDGLRACSSGLSAWRDDRREGLARAAPARRFQPHVSLNGRAPCRGADRSLLAPYASGLRWTARPIP